jgi:hypothetical protein
MVPPSERGQAGDDERGIVERGLVVTFQPALQPARRDARVPVRLLERDQRGQLEQLDEGRPRDLDPERRLRERQVAALDRALEDRLRVALCGDRLLASRGRPTDPSALGQSRERRREASSVIERSRSATVGAGWTVISSSAPVSSRNPSR